MSIASQLLCKRIQFRPVGSNKVFTIKIPNKIWEAIVTAKATGGLDTYESWLSCLKRLDVQLAHNDIEWVQRLLRIGQENHFWKQPQPGELLLRGGVPFALNSRDDLLWLMQFHIFRDLTGLASRTVFKNACAQAILHNDLQFFVKLGRRLTQKPKPTIELAPKNPGDNLRQLIALHWMDFTDSGVDFCFFTDKALCQFIRHVVPDFKPTPEAVKLTRKRLDLRHPIKPPIHSAILKGNEILLK